MASIAFKAEHFTDMKTVSECCVEDFLGGIYCRCMQVSVHVLSSRDAFKKINNIY